MYPYGRTLGVILGSVSSSKSGIPKEEVDFYLEKGYSLNDRVGVSGLEKYYEERRRKDTLADSCKHHHGNSHHAGYHQLHGSPLISLNSPSAPQGAVGLP